MLSELHIKNFAVIEDAQLRLGPGLTIISGEEGAGKSLMVDALGVLLGARATTGLIRNGKSTARVEGIFWLSAETIEKLSTILQDSAIEIDSDGIPTINFYGFDKKHRHLQTPGYGIFN